MNDRPSKEDREALIVNDQVDALEPEAAAELALLADLLADPSTWVAPRAGLEDAVVDAVAGAPAPNASPSPTRRRRFSLAAVAAAAAIAIAFGTVVVARRSTSADFDARLQATALAPGAHASAGITRNGAGFRIVLDARGLPTLPAGQYYQAWLKNPAGTLVPIGTSPVMTTISASKSMPCRTSATMSSQGPSRSSLPPWYINGSV